MTVSKQEKLRRWVSMMLVCIMTVCAMPSARAEATPYIVTGSTVNVRSQADASSELLGKVSKGDKLEVVGRNGDWLLVLYGSGVGYMLSDYLTPEDEEYVPGEDMNATGVVISDAITVMSFPSLNSSARYTISKGESVTVTQVDGKWYGVISDKGSGYVLKEYVRLSSATGDIIVTELTGTATVTGQGVIMRSKPDTSSDKVTKLDKDEQVTLTGVSGEWYRVKYNAYEGYMLGKYLDVKIDVPVNYTTLKQGDTGDAVKTLQTRLAELKYLDATPNGTFGPATLAAVKLFQKAAGLTSDGIAGSDTQKALYSPSAPINPAVVNYATLKQGDTGEAVTKLQNRLYELGYMTVSATGTYGPQTTEAVKAFQIAAGLISDGIAGASTLAKVYASDAPVKAGATLQQGDTGDEVKRLQARLIELGYMSATATGTYGSATKSAVADFQSAAGITATGVADALTQRALYASDAPVSANGALKYGDRGDAVYGLQQRLIALGYLTGTPDSTYGASTQQAVYEFQIVAGLSATGVADKATQTALNASDAPKKPETVLRLGDKGDAVKTMQERLIALGYLTGEADGVFGTSTRMALMSFQVVCGLEPDGIAGNATLALVYSIDAPHKPDGTLREGNRGDAVRVLQRRLIALGYLSGSADGIFGASTTAAVKAFQIMAGLTADGVAGPSTQDILNSAAAPTPKPTATSKPTATPAPTSTPKPTATATTSTYGKLEYGDTGDSVKQLQTRLRELKYMTSSADGEYGDLTIKAVMLFQKQNGLTVDGVAGTATQKALYASDAPEYDGKTSVDDEINESSSTAEKIIATAKQYLGCDYVYGANGPNTFDCTGFTCFVFKKYGYSLQRSAYEQGYDSSYEKLSRSQLRMGDLVFFNTISDSDLSDHAGIYIGDGNFIHCSSSSSQSGVKISSLDSGYYDRVFSWGRRILS